MKEEKQKCKTIIFGGQIAEEVVSKEVVITKWVKKEEVQNE